MKSTTRKLSPTEQAAAKKKRGPSKSLADDAKAEKKRLAAKPKKKPVRVAKVKPKARKPQDLVGKGSIADQVGKAKGLNPTRQRKSPQYGPSKQY